MSADAPPTKLEAHVEALYRHRFPEAMLARRTAVWKTLCSSWFSRYIPRTARVLEVAAGYCEFINNVEAVQRAAVDLNPDVRRHAAPGVTVQLGSACALADLFPAESFDVAFMSNFLEHCRSREDVLEVLRGVSRVLAPGGRVLILGPNFRYCYREYYDYFDHHLALTERSVVEALELCGFTLEVVEPRTLPYSFKSLLPSWPWLVRLYLMLRPAWRIFGAQFFVVARRSGNRV